MLAAGIDYELLTPHEADFIAHWGAGSPDDYFLIVFQSALEEAGWTIVAFQQVVDGDLPGSVDPGDGTWIRAQVWQNADATGCQGPSSAAVEIL